MRSSDDDPCKCIDDAASLDGCWIIRRVVRSESFQEAVEAAAASERHAVKAVDDEEEEG